MFFFLGVRDVRDNTGTSLVGLQRAKPTSPGSGNRRWWCWCRCSHHRSDGTWEDGETTGRSRNGTRPRPRGGRGTPARVKFFNPLEWVFFSTKKGAGYFFWKSVCFFWFEVGLYGPTQRARESLKWFYFIFVKYSDKICIILRTWHYLSW